MGLHAQHSQPEVHPAQPERDQRVRAGLSLLGLPLRRSESTVVVLVRQREGRERDEREGQEQVEVEEQVGEVERPGLGAVQVGRAAGGVEQVVEQDVERGEGRTSVRVRVDQVDRDL